MLEVYYLSINEVLNPMRMNMQKDKNFYEEIIQTMGIKIINKYINLLIFFSN